MSRIPNATKEKIALIARGSLDSEEVSQLLSSTFDAGDYLAVLRSFSALQEYIDGLYKVYCFYL